MVPVTRLEDDDDPVETGRSLFTRPTSEVCAS